MVDMSATPRPYRVTATNAAGYSRWTGSRTRAYATIDAARDAAWQLARTITQHSPDAAFISISEIPSGTLIERLEVTAE